MSAQYDLYLQRHKENVRKGYEWLSTNLPQLFEDKPDSSWQINMVLKVKSGELGMDHHIRLINLLEMIKLKKNENQKV